MSGLSCISPPQPLYDLESLQALLLVYLLMWSPVQSFRPEIFCCGQGKKRKGGEEGRDLEAWGVPVSPSESSADMNILICRAEE